jgi:hypothetical protein
MTRMQPLAVIVPVVVMVVVPMPVPVTDVNSDRTHSDFDVFSHDHRLIAGVRRTGKCRHGQERNSEQGKQSILHDSTFSLDWGPFGPIPVRMRACRC